MKRIALCADDFGFGPAVDAGILRLVEAGRLGAVSCQVTCKGFRAGAPALLAHADRVDLGLHLDLAEGRLGLVELLARSHARLLRRSAVAAAVARQLDAFEEIMGRPPDFVDGHQHVHQLPVVRDALIELLRARYPAPGPAVRNTVPLRPRGWKHALIVQLGGAGLRGALRANGTPHNGDFAGVYALEAGAPYPALFRGWLASVEDGALLLCHPGLPAGDPGDPIAEARAAELAYLSSPDFERDLADAGAVARRLTVIAR